MITQSELKSLLMYDSVTGVFKKNLKMEILEVLAGIVVMVILG